MEDPVNILLVDDQPRNLDTLEAILGAPDVRLVRATSADEALLALLKGSFAAIVLDIKMPGVDGIELAQIIKQRKRTRDIPILFLTAHIMEEKEILQGYVAGAVDYLSKPIDPQILRSKIGVFVDLFRKTQALAVANQALENEIAERLKAEDALRRANEDLEQRVRDRTADLSRSNKALQMHAEERERLLQSETAARTELERQSRLKDEFLATLSHELRTPLTAILAWTQILSRLHEGGKVAQGVAVIERNARAQAKLIEDLLDMSRIISGKVRMELQPIFVSDVVDAAFASVKPSADAKGVQLTKIAEPQSGPVSGDASRLQQVVWNLLTNAVKFTPAGGLVNVLVEMHATEPANGDRVSSPGPQAPGASPRLDRRRGARVEIIVQDTGQGIAPEFLPHVFDRFRQADGSTTRRHGGLGLGLSIVRHLVELHGGTARVESQGEGKGSTFVIDLPMANARREASDEELAPPPSSSGGLTATDVPELRGVRVLAVDDEADTREAIRQMLAACDAEVTTAGSVEEALSRLEKGSFDVLVSDIGMPERDGYALIREIRHREEDPSRRLPAIALTAFARPEDRWRAMREGFNIYIAKPVEQIELVVAIASLTRRLHETAPHVAPQG